MNIHEIRVPQRNVRGNKTRNPGYQAGNHWVICDRCGCAIRAKDSMTTWEGYVVCPDDWEPRHPQDFVRARQDRITPDGPIRPEQDDNYLPGPSLHSAIPSYAIPGFSWPSVTP